MAPALPLIGGGDTKLQPVYVGDVAEVRVAYKKLESLSRRYGLTSNGLSVRRASGANVFLKNARRVMRLHSISRLSHTSRRMPTNLPVSSTPIAICIYRARLTCLISLNTVVR